MEPRIIKGRYASAVVYVVNLDPMSEKQIQTLCDAPFVEGEDIRIMPDAHAGDHHAGAASDPDDPSG